MYCKACGHRSDIRAPACPKCGAAAFSTPDKVDAAPKTGVRWYVVAPVTVIAVIAFFVFPRVFLRTELEAIGPTDKLRFLRALEHSEYRRVGQRGFRIEGQRLVMIWDLTWNVLPEPKQKDIVRIVGRAWEVVGGEDTRFRIEGEDDGVAVYTKGKVDLNSTPP